MVLKDGAWKIAQQAASEIPPYLQDDELTVERFFERNQDKMSKNEARAILEALATDGLLEKQTRRRKGKGSGHVVVYVEKGSK